MKIPNSKKKLNFNERSDKLLLRWVTLVMGADLRELTQERWFDPEGAEFKAAFKWLSTNPAFLLVGASTKNPKVFEGYLMSVYTLGTRTILFLKNIGHHSPEMIAGFIDELCHSVSQDYLDKDFSAYYTEGDGSLKKAITSSTSFWLKTLLSSPKEAVNPNSKARKRAILFLEVSMIRHFKGESTVSVISELIGLSVLNKTDIEPCLKDSIAAKKAIEAFKNLAEVDLPTLSHLSKDEECVKAVVDIICDTASSLLSRFGERGSQ